jgi:hypothetical protein
VKPKTLKELRSMGVVASLAEQMLDFQKKNQIGTLEMVMMLQNYQCYLMDMMILAQEQEDEE